MPQSGCVMPSMQAGTGASLATCIDFSPWRGPAGACGPSRQIVTRPSHPSQGCPRGAPRRVPGPLPEGRSADSLASNLDIQNRSHHCAIPSHHPSPKFNGSLASLSPPSCRTRPGLRRPDRDHHLTVRPSHREVRRAQCQAPSGPSPSRPGPVTSGLRMIA